MRRILSYCELKRKSTNLELSLNTFFHVSLVLTETKLSWKGDALIPVEKVDTVVHVKS